MLSDLTKKTAKKATKGPSLYNQRNRTLIYDMINHNDPVVRQAVCENTSCPTTMIKQRLIIETDKDVLRALLLNPNTPLNAIGAFCDSSAADIFKDDKDLENSLKERFGDAVTDSSNDDDTQAAEDLLNEITE